MLLLLSAGVCDHFDVFSYLLHFIQLR